MYVLVWYKATTEHNLYKITQYITIKFTVDYRKFYFNSEISVLKSVESLQPMINKIMEDFEACIPRDGSSYKSGGVKIDVKMNKSKQIYGDSYVDLPAFIKNKKARVNIKNVLSCKKEITIYDYKRFLWSLLASKHYDNIKKIECRYYKQILSTISIPDTVVYPVPIDDITLWEECNKIKVKVFELDENEEQLILMYEYLDKNVNLINFYKNYHVSIKNLNRFEFSNNNKHRLYRCLQCNDKRYDSLEKLEKQCTRIR